MYKKSDIYDYKNKLTEKQEKQVINHCNKNKIEPKICAWYMDIDDFYYDWQKIGFTKDEADDKLSNREVPGEFLIFENKEIIRFEH